MTKHSRGFTLIEVMIVVALIGIASAIAIPNVLSQLPKWHANGATRDVMANMMMARLKAIQNNKRYGVKFTLGTKDSYTFQRYSTNADVWVNDGVENQTTSDVNIIPSSNCLSGGVYRATFNPNGTSGSCNSIAIKTQDETLTRKISVTTNTGNIKVKYCEQEGVVCD